MKTFKALGAAALLSTSLLGAVTSFAASSDPSMNPNPATAQTPVKAKFKLPEGGGENEKPVDPTDPDNPDKNPDGNKPLNPTGPFGIAYVPNQWATPNVDGDGEELQEKGSQEFAFTAAESHVGVKDKTHDTVGWTLKAKLTWNDKELPGATIQTTSDGNVKINNGGDDAGAYETTEKATTPSTTLTITDKDTIIMQGEDLSAKEGETHNSTYDLFLGSPTLKIADVEQVQAGSYTGNVNWTLAKAGV